MKRYQFEYGCMENDLEADGEHVLYKDVEPIIADRDIKAANLQLLVENVLSYDALAARFVDGPPYDDAGKDADFLWTQLVDLARSLKQ